MRNGDCLRHPRYWRDRVSTVRQSCVAKAVWVYCMVGPYMHSGAGLASMLLLARVWFVAFRGVVKERCAGVVAGDNRKDDSARKEKRRRTRSPTAWLILAAILFILKQRSGYIVAICCCMPSWSGNRLINASAGLCGLGSYW